MTVKTFAEELREKSGKKHQMKRARDHADELVEKHRAAAKAYASEQPEWGRRSAQYVSNPPYCVGNLIPEQVMVDEIVEALRKEGLKVRAEISIFDDRTNINKLRVFMEW